jgi:hypothetical protein
MFLTFITIWSREQRIAWTENRDREVVRRTSCERSSRPNRWRGHLLSPKYRARANASLIPCIHDPSFSSNVHLWRPANGLLVPRRPVHHLPSYQVLYRWLMSPRLAFRSNTVPIVRHTNWIRIGSSYSMLWKTVRFDKPDGPLLSILTAVRGVVGAWRGCFSSN